MFVPSRSVQRAGFTAAAVLVAVAASLAPIPSRTASGSWPAAVVSSVPNDLAPDPMIPASHHGAWSGANRLWTTGPDKSPARSDGKLEVVAEGVDYSWSHAGKEHRGTVRVYGQPCALRVAFEDSFHAADGMALHGALHDGVLRAYGTYPAGPDQPEWGWILELDWRDPEEFVLRMFNGVPGVGAVPAVVLRGTR